MPSIKWFREKPPGRRERDIRVFTKYRLPDFVQISSSRAKNFLFEEGTAMFAVWKYGTEADNVQHIRQAADPAAFTRLQACNRCHSKKVSASTISGDLNIIKVHRGEPGADSSWQIKCSGDKDGCARCVAGGHACDYNRSSLRFRKSKSPEGSVKSASPTPFPHRRSTSSAKHEKRRSARAMQPTPPPSTTGSPIAGFANEVFSTHASSSMLEPMDPIDMMCPPMTRSVPFSLYETHGVPDGCYDDNWPSYTSGYPTAVVPDLSAEYLQLLHPSRDELEYYTASRRFGVWPQQ